MVAIILVIAAIAIPNLMRARMAANDSSAAGSIHAINVAEVGYFGAYETIGFPATLAPLGGAQPCAPTIATACLIDQSLASGGPKSGYNFAATGSSATGSGVNNGSMHAIDVAEIGLLRRLRNHRLPGNSDVAGRGSLALQTSPRPVSSTNL